MKAGDKLWFAPWDPKHRYYCQREVTIAKVGRKYLTLEGVNGGRVNKESLVMDGGQFHSPGRCWPSKEAYDYFTQRVALWNAIRTVVDKQRQVPTHLDVASLMWHLDALKERT